MLFIRSRDADFHHEIKAKKIDRFSSSLWAFYSKVIADLSYKILLDLTMSGDGCHLAVQDIFIHRVPTAFTTKQTIVVFQMPNEIFSFHLMRPARSATL